MCRYADVYATACPPACPRTNASTHTGRLKFSLNPFKMFSALLGPSVCMKFMCCLACVAFILLMIFAGPMMNMMLQIYLSKR